MYKRQVLHRVHSSVYSYGALAEDDGDSVDSIDPSANSELVCGTVQRNFNGIRFENIDVVIPSKFGRDGIKLINRLRFQVPPVIGLDNNNSDSQINLSQKLMFKGPGSSMLILGPNGSGKTSIQRIIAEIWPIYNKNGLLSVPAERELICIPQKPYFIQGGTCLLYTSRCV